MRFQSANAASRNYDGLLSSEEEPEQEPTDWIEKNINNAAEYALENERRIYKQSELLERRTEHYKQNRAFEAAEKMKFNIMALHKWDFIRGIREE